MVFSQAVSPFERSEIPFGQSSRRTSSDEIGIGSPIETFMHLMIGATGQNPLKTVALAVLGSRSAGNLRADTDRSPKSTHDSSFRLLAVNNTGRSKLPLNLLSCPGRIIPPGFFFARDSTTHPLHAQTRLRPSPRAELVARERWGGTTASCADNPHSPVALEEPDTSQGRQEVKRSPRSGPVHREVAAYPLCPTRTRNLLVPWPRDRGLYPCGKEPRSASPSRSTWLHAFSVSPPS